MLTTYPLIARDREVLLSRDWHMAVLDEAQTVKNPDGRDHPLAARRQGAASLLPDRHADGKSSRRALVDHEFCQSGLSRRQGRFPRQWRVADREARRQGTRDGAGPAGQTVSAAPDQGGGRDRTACQERDRRADRVGGQSARPLRFDPACRCRKRFARRSRSAAWPGATSSCSKPCSECGRPVAIRAAETRRRCRAAFGQARST